MSLIHKLKQQISQPASLMVGNRKMYEEGQKKRQAMAKKMRSPIVKEGLNK